MRTLNTWLIIVLAATIGAVGTWLWARKETAPTPDGTTVKPQSEARQAALPDASGTSRLPLDAHSGKSSAPTATPPSRDDSTYSGMLAFAQSLPNATDMTRRITQTHERFALTPDDPDWGRRTEQALRDFFRARSAKGGLEITSVSCRSAGCEVQAQVQPTKEYLDAPLANDQLEEPPFVTANGERASEDPRAAIREAMPVGPSLKLEGAVGSRVGDRIGFIVSYRRVQPRPEATSP